MSNVTPTLYARKTEDGRLQSLHDHCRSVARTAAAAGEAIGLTNLLTLCGLLHDLGKCADAFQTYLLEGDRSRRGSVAHAAQGAVFARQRWGQGDRAAALTADLLAVAMCAHHGQLPDLLSDKGDAFLEDALHPQRFAAPEERAPEPLQTLLPRFYAQVAGEAELDALFAKARAEVQQVLRERINPACRDIALNKTDNQTENARDGLLGLLQRGVYSALIDADRLDAYRFEAGEAAESTPQPPWEGWIANLETKLAGFAQDTRIGKLRGEISGECLKHAGAGAGVYRLAVPTGGGKTFAAMRFALATAKAQGMSRIVYAAPYKAILEQTAEELRTALGYPEQMLEHHSDVTFAPKEGAQGDAAGRDLRTEDAALRRYQYLTQRWDSPLVLTTTVQLLNTLFAGGSASVRRFAALAGSVIILDEAQCVPVKCWYLLTNAIRFLTGVMGCAVVLCIATQPPWDRLADYPLPTPTPLIADEARLHEAFRRVRLLDRTAEGDFSPDQLADAVLRARATAGSALCILNTKASALALHAAFVQRMPDGVPLYCLTTYQCPAHRREIIQDMRARLKAGEPLVCVATQLSEAGVEVSFGLTVRALAGLESVTQAAGRCNRHGERTDGGLGEVWLVKVQGERLGSLAEIKAAQERTLALLKPMQAANDPRLNDLLAPAVLERYFDKILSAQNASMYYIVNQKRYEHDSGTLFGLLCSNRDGRTAYEDKPSHIPYKPLLAQAFHTAGTRFAPIEDATTPVLVPYGAGAALAEQLRAERDLKTLRRLLREAQPYCVGVYERDLQTLQQNNAITCREDVRLYLLDAAYYRGKLGLTTERQALPDYQL